MLQKNLQTYENQDNTTYNTCRFLIFRTKHMANLHTQNGEHERGDADDNHRRPQLHLNTSERNAHRQGINAGGNGQKEHRFEIEGIVVFAFFLFAPNNFANHVGTDEEE